MNAPHQISEGPELGDVDDFIECIEHHAWYFAEGWIDLHTAVDNLQRLAERWNLVDAVGQDRIQEIIAAPFARIRAIPATQQPQLLGAA